MHPDVCPVCHGVPIRVNGGHAVYTCPVCLEGADADDALAALPPEVLAVADQPPSAPSRLVASLTTELIRRRKEAQRLADMAAAARSAQRQAERHNLTLRSQLDQADARWLDRADPAVLRLIDVAATLVAESRERQRRRGIQAPSGCDCRLCELEAALAAIT